MPEGIARIDEDRRQPSLFRTPQRGFRRPRDRKIGPGDLLHFETGAADVARMHPTEIGIETGDPVTSTDEDLLLRALDGLLEEDEEVDLTARLEKEPTLSRR